MTSIDCGSIFLWPPFAVHRRHWTLHIPVQGQTTRLGHLGLRISTQVCRYLIEFTLHLKDYKRTLDHTEPTEQGARGCEHGARVYHGPSQQIREMSTAPTPL
ncbi:hypothetical protein QC764_0024610 [Podospora pseudoanserina]|uniref:Uncharacterized protein n=1 Tax=Podospora pseudoanserina TaxID=2609844 RepID=A0ABR0IRD8_9PEZI|nr:hypothetical protein QC764_0024610 [Podospora pseudoanserina]